MVHAGLDENKKGSGNKMVTERKKNKWLALGSVLSCAMTSLLNHRLWSSAKNNSGLYNK